MLQNYLTEIKTPEYFADSIRAHQINLAGFTDEQVYILCEDAIFSDSSSAGLSASSKILLINRTFACLRRELEILQETLDDKSITELMVNGPENIFFERNGMIFRADYVLDSKEQLRRIIQRLCAKVGREMNDLNPIVDARLYDGSRVHAVNDNIAIGGPVLTIRKFTKSRMTIEDLIEQGDITKEASGFVKALVESAYNIFISGGTSSGKTTFLNVLSDYIPENERIIVIEDSAELQIRGHENLVRMEAKAANVQGKGGVSIGDLVKASLRMRPDRIIVGEVRGGEETVDMLNAMNTGHDGSLSTGHANSPSGMLKRLESLYIAQSGFPLASVKSQLAEALEIIIQLKRFPDGHRRVTEISEVVGIENGEIKLNKLFEFDASKGLQRTNSEFQRQRKLREKFGDDFRI